MAVVLPEAQSEVVDDLHPATKPSEGEELVDLNAVEEPAKPAAPAPAAAAAPAAPAEDELPEDLRGKTPAQLAKMVRDAQQLIGRQGSELGEFRKKADLLIHANLAELAARRSQPAPEKPAEPATPAAKALEDVDFFARPQEAISQAIASHPLIKQLEKTLGESAANQEIERATKSTQKFNEAHPDAATIMADPGFRTWVQSSRVRTQLLHRAHHSFDFEAGDEVFSTWKALNKVAAPAAPATDTSVSDAARTLAAAATKKKQDLAAAGVPTGGNAAPAKAGVKKIYRRADVLNLMENDPKRYEQLASEIELAYRENRVR